MALHKDHLGRWNKVVNLGGQETVLREATVADADRILRMSREICGPWDFYHGALRPLFRKPRARIFVSEREGNIVSLSSLSHQVFV
jgi:hypothetical protein